MGQREKGRCEVGDLLYHLFKAAWKVDLFKVSRYHLERKYEIAMIHL